jgi:photosystem II stability/assembly factor-like uncharacterized protein
MAEGVPVRRALCFLALVILAVACTDPTPAAITPASPPVTERASPPQTPKPQPTPKHEPDPIVDPKNPVAPGFSPLSVAFWGGNNGLLAGTIYRYQGRARAGAIAMTHDGGATWQLVYDAPVTLTDDLRVAAGGLAFATRGYRHPKIVSSDDGGAHWRPWPDSGGLSHPSFISSDEGWALSKFGYGLVHWSHGAWHRMHSPCEEIVDISFPEDGNGRGWAACTWGASAGNELHGIYETDDGGQTWRARAVAMPTDPSQSQGEGLGTYGYFDAISFLPDGSGWLVESRGTFLTTEDGGWSWRPHAGFQEPEAAFGSSAWRVDDAVGFVLMGRIWGMVLTGTDDGGDTWSRLQVFHSPV